jgi:hypothetical protein
MKKHIAIVAGALLTLGTAVAATLSDESQANKVAMTVETSAATMGAKQSAQIVALWKSHATSSGSVPLARPL